MPLGGAGGNAQGWHAGVRLQRNLEARSGGTTTQNHRPPRQKQRGRGDSNAHARQVPSGKLDGGSAWRGGKKGGAPIGYAARGAHRPSTAAELQSVRNRPVAVGRKKAGGK